MPVCHKAGHADVHGSNLGLRVDVFMAPGGFNDVELSKDGNFCGPGIPAQFLGRRHRCMPGLPLGYLLSRFEGNAVSSISLQN